MKKFIFNTLSILLITIFVGSILALTLHGVSGNPNPEFIVKNLQSETKPFELSPERGRYGLTMSITENHSFIFTEDIARFIVPDLGTINGNYVSLFAPGVSFLAIPFYLIGKNLNLAQVFTFSLSSFFATVNVLLIFLIVNKLTRRKSIAAISALTFIFATTAWVYAVTLYQHHVTTALILGAAYLLIGKMKWYTSLIFGLLLGLSFIIEYPNIIFFIPLTFLLISKHISVSDIENKIKISVKLALILGLFGLIFGLLPNFWYNQRAHGNFLKLTGTLKSVKSIDVVNTQTVNNDVKNIVKEKTATGFFKASNLPNSMSVLLSSTDRGLIFFSPVIILGLLGFAPLTKKYQGVAFALLGGIIVIFSLYGMWGDPWGGWAFGPRYLIPAMAQLAVLLGVAISYYGKKIWFALIFIPLFLYSLFVNLTGALTTNQIPPSVESDSARYPKITYLHNYKMIEQGKSASYVYNTYFAKTISLIDFAVILFTTISVIVLILYLLNQRTKKMEIIS